jgi:hypothetical protein
MQDQIQKDMNTFATLQVILGQIDEMIVELGHLQDDLRLLSADTPPMVKTVLELPIDQAGLTKLGLKFAKTYITGEIERMRDAEKD